MEEKEPLFGLIISKMPSLYFRLLEYARFGVVVHNGKMICAIFLNLYILIVQ